MATRKPALSTQLKNALKKIEKMEGYDAKENSAMTHIAAWLAVKGGQA